MRQGVLQDRILHRAAKERGQEEEEEEDEDEEEEEQELVLHSEGEAEENVWWMDWDTFALLQIQRCIDLTDRWTNSILGWKLKE